LKEVGEESKEGQHGKITTSKSGYFPMVYNTFYVYRYFLVGVCRPSTMIAPSPPHM
jgi:hypothetical protein